MLTLQTCTSIVTSIDAMNTALTAGVAKDVAWEFLKLDELTQVFPTDLINNLVNLAAEHYAGGRNLKLTATLMLIEEIATAQLAKLTN